MDERDVGAGEKSGHHRAIFANHQNPNVGESGARGGENDGMPLFVVEGALFNHAVRMAI